MRLVLLLTAVMFGVSATVVATRVAASAPKRSAGRAASTTCGVERWTVKTLQDRPTLISAQPTTIAHMVSLARPAHIPATRLPFERHIFSVTAAVTLVRQEADQDLHLVLQSGASHMIAEAPDAPACTANASALRKHQMATARQAVRLCARARVVGVAFWDFKHHQTGVAPNAIELHPILEFACLS